MNGAGIAERVRFGYAKAGAKLGLAHSLYRPIGPLVPALDGGNRLRSLTFISSATPDVSFRRPSKFGEPIRYGLFDTRVTRPGDYIDGDSGTFWIASQEDDEGPMVVQCNAIIRVLRAGPLSVANEDTYGGRTVATDTVLLESWPASVLDGGRMDSPRSGLPGDYHQKGKQVLLPAWPGLILRASDRITTDQGHTLTIAGAELSDLGWRVLTNPSAA